MEQKNSINKKSFNLYNKFLGFLIKNGNKTSAKNILESTLIKASKKFKMSKISLFLKLFFKLNTFVETKKIKIRKRSFIVPFSLSVKRRSYLVIKWILESVRENENRISMSEKLLLEINNLLTQKDSKTLFLKKTNNAQAFLNRSNSHYRW